MEVKLLVPGLEKLVDVVSSGIGSVAGPMLTPWRARRESEANLIRTEGSATELRILAQAQADARRLLVAESSTVSGNIDVGDAIRQRIEFQERKRQANIVAVVNHAAREVEGSTAPGVEPNHDWTARFFGDVQDVSSQDMQLLWGRVLAGEVRAPSTTSMRTLRILKDLDVPTAQLFSLLCSLAVFVKRSDGTILDARVPALGGDAAQNSLLKYGLGFDALNRLNEHGLIIADYDSSASYWTVGQSQAGSDEELLHQGVSWDLDIQTEGLKEVPVKLHGVALTVAGRELSRVVQHEETQEYTEALQGFLQRRFSVTMRRNIHYESA